MIVYPYEIADFSIFVSRFLTAPLHRSRFTAVRSIRGSTRAGGLDDVVMAMDYMAELLSTNIGPVCLYRVTYMVVPVVDVVVDLILKAVVNTEVHICSDNKRTNVCHCSRDPHASSGYLRLLLG